MRQTVQVIGRRHAHNESDSCPPVNRIIIPPRVLPLLLLPLVESPSVEIQASAPIPKFASLRGTLSCELRNQRSTRLAGRERFGAATHGRVDGVEILLG